MAQAQLLPFPNTKNDAAETAADRVRHCGAKALTNEELLTYLIGPDAGALATPARWSEWIGVSYEGLCSKGLRDEEAVRYLAAIELTRRLARMRMKETPILRRPDLCANYLALRYFESAQEVMGAVFLDSRNRLITDEVLFRGTLSRASVEPRPILKRALELDAAGFVLFHTHPSGDPAPSSEDLAFTRQLAAASEVMALRLQDHLIVASCGRWVSLRRRGSW